MRIPLTAIAVAAGLSLSACAYDGYYSGVSLGVGSGYYDPYYSYGYGYPRYSYGYGYRPYWGWYDSFYYPGSGFYVYDRYRRPHRWTDAQRRYWLDRRERAISSSRDRVIVQENWSGFRRDRAGVRSQRIERSRPVRVERSSVRPKANSTVVRQSRPAARSERNRGSSVRRGWQARQD